MVRTGQGEALCDVTLGPKLLPKCPSFPRVEVQMPRTARGSSQLKDLHSIHTIPAICIQMRDEGGDQVLFSSYYIPCVRQEGEKNEQIRPHSSFTGGKTKAEIGRKNLILTDDNFWPSQWPHYLYRNKAFRSHLSQLPCFTEGGTDEQGERASPPEPPSLLNCEVMLQLLGLSFSLFLGLVTV